MVDHEILIQRLQSTYSIHGSVLQWFRSYLLGRTQHARRGSARSSAVDLVCGVPQGSVIGPILFILYTADLVALNESLGLSPHLYADDAQIYGSCTPSRVDIFLLEVTNCVAAVADWMQSSGLQLNDNKTEFMWCTTDRRDIACPLLVLPSVLLVQIQHLRLVILASTLTRTCQCVVTSGEPCRAVLPLFARYAPTGVKSQPLCSSLWLPRLFYLTETTVTACCIVCPLH